jgi:hypothetical protein
VERVSFDAAYGNERMTAVLSPAQAAPRPAPAAGVFPGLQRDQHDQRIVYEGGHDVPRTQLIMETLRWLDTHLGPVR